MLSVRDFSIRLAFAARHQPLFGDATDERFKSHAHMFRGAVPKELRELIDAYGGVVRACARAIVAVGRCAVFAVRCARTFVRKQRNGYNRGTRPFSCSNVVICCVTAPPRFRMSQPI